MSPQGRDSLGGQSMLRESIYFNSINLFTPVLLTHRHINTHS